MLAICVVALVILVVGLATGATTRPNVRNGWLGTGDVKAARRVVQNQGGANEHTFRAVFVQEHFAINVHPDGFDEFVISGPVRNAAETRRIGFLAGHCTQADPQLFECELTANFGPPFPGGSSISIQGLSSAATHWFNAVTGGTGRFDEVSGEVEARNIGATNKIALVFHLED